MSREQAAVVLCVAGLVLAALVWLVLRSAPASRLYRPARLEDLLGVPPASPAGGATLAEALMAERMGAMPWFDSDGVLHLMVHPDLAPIDDHLEVVAARLERPGR